MVIRLVPRSPINQRSIISFCSRLYGMCAIAVIAAGHAAGYVMEAGAIDTLWARIVLVAPTWRGPLPTMMGQQKPWFATIRQTIGTPPLGQALYKLNTLRSFLSF
ncbi:MAG TPA: alpha/beta hydrolase, partial [Candidatus Sericytochromatia bacterium]